MVALLLGTGMLVCSCSGSSAHAGLKTVHGSACGYFVNLGLFGGPQTLKGCGTTAPSTDQSFGPSVMLPAGGSATPITADDADGANAVYGPASVFGGVWPDNVASPPPSGPISVSTQGTAGAGSVTSSANVVLRSPANPASPGGFRGGASWGDELHSTCSATPKGVTGAASFVKAALLTSTDATGNPKDIQAVPANPPPNYTRSGVITNVGDVFTTVFNQQIVHPDGSLTVNAVHAYLFGPTAVGEVVAGQVTCGTTPRPSRLSDTIPPSCGLPVVEPVGPDNPTPKTPRTELVGVFDAGTGAAASGVSISKGHAINATVHAGNPDPAYPAYARFTPGQTGPLPITATRDDATRPMSWSFDATDAAGNVSHCSGAPTPR